MNIDINKLYSPKIIQENEDMLEIDEILEQEEMLYVISEKIIIYRQKNKLTQTQLAEQLDVNQTMISKLESGKYNPTLKEIYKITRKLTKSTDLFNEILQEIVNNLKKYHSIQYNNSICIVNKMEEKVQDVEELYTHSNKDNIRYFKIERDNINKGEKYYEGKYQSAISNVG